MTRTFSNVTLSEAKGAMSGFGAFAPLRLTALLILTACGGGEPDAYGNFEATEVTVAAEVGGRLLAFRLEEGDRVNGDSVLGVVDTLPLLLEREAAPARDTGRMPETGRMPDVGMAPG